MKTFSLSRAVVTVILSVCAIAGASGAQVTPPAAFLARAAGVYKEQSPSENLLEVVSVDDGHAYIRLQLKFHNGPMGSIYGIATYSGHDSLVYDNGKMGNERCLLEITWSKLYVTSFPSHRKTVGCPEFDGPPGSPDRIRFRVARKLDITYMPRLKDSREFRSAMDEYRARTAG